MEKSERQQALLKAIVDAYITSAHPVGSKTLAMEYGFDYSPATIRNDMAALEEAGYIMQPHTSAGRVPTEKGYQYYIQHFLRHPSLPQREQTVLHDVIKEDEHSMDWVRHVAKTIADLSEETVVVSFDDGNYVYAGISHLFRKPEFFQETALMASMSEVFDHMDEVMQDVNQKMSDGVQVWIGRENPFSRNCSVVLSEYGFTDDDAHGVIGILGPMRMNYETNVAILEYMESLMKHDHEHAT